MSRKQRISKSNVLLQSLSLLDAVWQASKVKGDVQRYVGLVMNIELIISIESCSGYHCLNATIERLQLEKGSMGKTVYQVLLVDIIKYNQRQNGWKGGFSSISDKMLIVECFLRYRIQMDQG